MLRHLVAANVLTLDGEGHFGLTDYSSALATAQIGSTVGYYSEVQAPAFLNLPDFLAKTDFVNPSNQSSGNFESLKGQQLFSWAAEHPEIGADLNTVFATSAANRGNWVDAFPSQELINNSKRDGPLLVDFGGNTGYDLERFRSQYPQTGHRLILEDLPEVLDGITSLNGSITRIAHDFFKPQPVKGKRNVLNVIYSDPGD